VQRIRRLYDHPISGPTIRYAIVGVIVGIVYMGIPVGMNYAFGVPVEVAIPVAYVTAVSLHFTLQRFFVWRHIARFALSWRAQVARYAMMGVVQYPLTALLTAVLPAVLHLSQPATFVCITMGISLVTFIALRSFVFHEDRRVSG
jgi:putative flippase GtrA